MDQNDGKLIRINDPSEIKVGMACKLINCHYCSSSHVFNITDKAPYSGDTIGWDNRDGVYYNGFKFQANPSPCGIGFNGYFVIVETIKEGRLFAIVDENPNFEETIVVKSKPIKIVDKLERIK